jgi:hypothetical protein
MAKRTVVIRQCRTHPGGRFESPSRRGRPPTSCAPAYPCSASGTHIPAKPKRSTPRSRVEHAAATPEGQSEPRSQDSESLSKAKAAKALLEPQGWTIEGRAWTPEDAAGQWASITGVRGEELISMVWNSDGELHSSDYSLWNTQRISANGAPKAHLPFDVDEIPDARLVPYLAGMKLTWHNKLKGGPETAYAGKSIEIMHVYDNLGEELPGDRTIRFIDATGTGYRAFRLSALLKVGVGKAEPE